MRYHLLDILVESERRMLTESARIVAVFLAFILRPYFRQARYVLWRSQNCDSSSLSRWSVVALDNSVFSQESLNIFCTLEVLLVKSYLLCGECSACVPVAFYITLV